MSDPATSPLPPMLSVEAALAQVLAAAPGPTELEDVPTSEAIGRVLGADVVSELDLPPWDNSSMDGYAVRSEDLKGPGPYADATTPVLRIVGEVAAGGTPDVTLTEGVAVRIATGAPLPPGADAVVEVEETTPLRADGLAMGPRGGAAVGPLPAACRVHVPIRAGRNVRPRGEDVRAGQVLLASPRRLWAGDVALAAAVGRGAVRVHRRPIVGVLATGDELRAPGEPLGAAGIPDSNRPALLAQIRAYGAEPVDLGIARDVQEDVLTRLRDGVNRCDVVVVSGGVSVGPYDVVRGAFGVVGSVDLWRVAMQPGKPFAFGQAKPRADGRRPILFGLPGNPVSTFVTFELFVRPLVALLAGDRAGTAVEDRAVLDDATSKAPGRRSFLRVRVDRDDAGRPARDANGRLHVRLAGGQGSHVISALAAADALAIVPESVDHVEAGTEVDLHWLARP